MNYRQVAASVAKRKEKFPEQYCPHPRCLWKTNGGYCPRHPQLESIKKEEKECQN